MSAFEDSDFECETRGEGLDGKGEEGEMEEDCSDCESVNLGEDILEWKEHSEDSKLSVAEPSMTFGCSQRRRKIIIEDHDEGSDLDHEASTESYLPPSLDTTPDFEPLRTTFQSHTAETQNLPSTMDLNSPLAFFKLFVTDKDFDTFATNTNLYAESKNAGFKQKKGPGHRILPWLPKAQRPWGATTGRELMVWFALLIFMGLVKVARVDLYWKKDGDCVFSPMAFMSIKRFEQLKRYFHLSAPTKPEEKLSSWYQKIEPFGVRLREASTKYLLPASEVSIDEMMVRFSGRSSHTIKIKNKPIKQGYKLFALCYRGYTYSYLYYSRTKKIGGVKIIDNHSLTSSAVITLAKLLPYSQHRFDIYMDNYFTNIPLFKYLRSIGIGACGTTRQNSKQFPIAFAKKKTSKSIKPVWNTMEGEVVDGVLALLWMDNNYVLLLTTIHCVKGIDNYVMRVRRKPGLTSTNAKVVRPIFGDSYTRKLLIPVIINMYNLFMGGVDIADQLRSYWPTQLRVSRNWLPLFFWCLDTAIVNSFLLYRTANILSGRLSKELFTHRQFREKLYQELLLAGTPSNNATTSMVARRHHTIKTLPNLRHQSGNHERSKLPPKSKGGRPQRGYCAYCLWVQKQRVFGTSISRNQSARQRATQTRIICSFCKTFLCDGCFDLYHSN